jgi:hypothetical protein
MVKKATDKNGEPEADAPVGTDETAQTAGTTDMARDVAVNRASDSPAEGPGSVRVEVKAAAMQNTAVALADRLSSDSSLMPVVKDMARIRLGRDPFTNESIDDDWKAAVKWARNEILKLVAELEHPF